MIEQRETASSNFSPEQTNSSIRSKMQQLLVRAMKDEAWRQELLTHPKALIEQQLGVTLPQGVTIQVHEETPTTVHLVLPQQLRAVEVSDGDLRGPEEPNCTAPWEGICSQ